jgi:hypothetical protein
MEHAVNQVAMRRGIRIMLLVRCSLGVLVRQVKMCDETSCGMIWSEIEFVLGKLVGESHMY